MKQDIWLALCDLLRRKGFTSISRFVDASLDAEMIIAHFKGKAVAVKMDYAMFPGQISRELNRVVKEFERKKMELSGIDMKYDGCAF